MECIDRVDAIKKVEEMIGEIIEAAIPNNVYCGGKIEIMKPLKNRYFRQDYRMFWDKKILYHCRFNHVD